MTPKPDGEEIADDGNGADCPVDEEIQAHPCQDDLRHVKPRSQYQYEGPDEIGQDVAEPRNQSEQRIESHVEGRAWNLYGRIQNLG